MSRLFILLALCALASACATGRAFTKSPYSVPSRAKLVQEAQKPAPAQLYGEPVAEVASWTVEHARSTLGPAPFSGEHGWYWLNYNEFPVTVTLTVTGYFDDIIDYGIF